MTKSRFFPIFLVILAIAGVFIGGYGGGFMTGAFLILVVLSTIGRRQANQAGARIDKKIHDSILNRQPDDDGA